VVAAIAAGGSYTAVAEAAGLAKSTVQVWVKD
jgi:transposase